MRCLLSYQEGNQGAALVIHLEVVQLSMAMSCTLRVFSAYFVCLELVFLISSALDVKPTSSTSMADFQVEDADGTLENFLATVVGIDVFVHL